MPAGDAGAFSASSSVAAVNHNLQRLLAQIALSKKDRLEPDQTVIPMVRESRLFSIVLVILPEAIENVHRSTFIVEVQRMKWNAQLSRVDCQGASIRFELVTAKEGDTLAALAAASKMPLWFRRIPPTYSWRRGARSAVMSGVRFLVLKMM